MNESQLNNTIAAAAVTALIAMSKLKCTDKIFTLCSSLNWISLVLTFSCGVHGRRRLKSEQNFFADRQRKSIVIERFWLNNQPECNWYHGHPSHLFWFNAFTSLFTSFVVCWSSSSSSSSSPTRKQDNFRRFNYKYLCINRINVLFAFHSKSTRIMNTDWMETQCNDRAICSGGGRAQANKGSLVTLHAHWVNDTRINNNDDDADVKMCIESICCQVIGRKTATKWNTLTVNEAWKVKHQLPSAAENTVFRVWCEWSGRPSTSRHCSGIKIKVNYFMATTHIVKNQHPMQTQHTMFSHVLWGGTSKENSIHRLTWHGLSALIALYSHTHALTRSHFVSILFSCSLIFRWVLLYPRRWKGVEIATIRFGYWWCATKL